MMIYWNLMDAIANILAGTARAFVREILSSSYFGNGFKLRVTAAK
jgi:hypothetical protein